MSTAKTFAAFRSIGIDESRAMAAADELAGQSERLAKIEGKLDRHDWMLGVLIALCSTILFKLFSH